MLKRILIDVFRRMAISLANFHVGRLLYRLMLEGAMSMNVRVKHGNVEMIFASPNALTRYRADSFSSKEPETLIWLDTIPDGSVLWDVGANVGLYSIYASRRQNVFVFAFEPSVFNLELLARNVFMNEVQERVTIVPVALSDSLGPSLFKMSSTAWGGALSTFGQDFDQHGCHLNSIFEYQTMGITMDDAIRLLDIPAPQFLKIDVDGIEHLILRGATETLKNVKSVMVEIDDCFIEQAEESARLLQNAGLILLQKCGGAAGSQYNQWWVRGVN